MATKVLLSELARELPPYVIDQSEVPIYYVATKQDWEYCENRLLAATIVGLDTETKPVFKQHQPPNPCALLQIAVRDSFATQEIFILDLLQLSPELYNAALSKLFMSNTLKLGQGFYQDLKELAKSYPDASCFTVIETFIEVNDLSSMLSEGHLPLSLQKLVFFYLDRKLVKAQQMSNWERRPLSKAQLRYAASDALVLIDLYFEMLERSEKGLLKNFTPENVTTTLDVNVPLPLKCRLCFDYFETTTELKDHRKLCPAEMHKLQICAICKGKMLIPDKAMKEHVKQCKEKAV